MILLDRRCPFLPLVALPRWQLLSAASFLQTEVELGSLRLPMLQMRARGSSFVEALLVRTSGLLEATVDTSGSHNIETKQREVMGKS
jgi:hypothetical protein